jgi:hypothetical protein
MFCTYTTYANKITYYYSPFLYQLCILLPFCTPKLSIYHCFLKFIFLFLLVYIQNARRFHCDNSIDVCNGLGYSSSVMFTYPLLPSHLYQCFGGFHFSIIYIIYIIYIYICNVFHLPLLKKNFQKSHNAYIHKF